MSSYQTLFPFILPYVEGCALPMVEQHINRVVRDFCTRTRAWRYDCEGIVLMANVRTYDMNVPAGSGVVEIESATINGSRLTPMNEHQLEAKYPGWRDTQASIPIHYTLLESNQINFWPKPSESRLEHNVEIIASLRPVTGATGMLNTSLLEEYAELLSDGALASLLRVPRKEWSDPNYAAVYSEGYESKMTRAIIRERDARSQPRRAVRYGGL